jgi:hypothetical protein
MLPVGSKQIQITARLGDYLVLRKDQTEKAQQVIKDKKKREEDYSIEKCIDNGCHGKAVI